LIESWELWLYFYWKFEDIIFNILWSILLKHEFVVYFDSFDEKRL
jgi:hypothetical protein